MRAAPWLAVYVAVLIAWISFLASRKTPTLWKGRALGVLNGAFVFVVVATAIARGEMPDTGLSILLFALAITALAAHNIWLLLHLDRVAAERILEKCFAQTRAIHQRTANGYTIKLSDAEMQIVLTALPLAHNLRFSGSRTSKKADLIRALIGKQFAPSFPTLTIRT